MVPKWHRSDTGLPPGKRIGQRGGNRSGDPYGRAGAAPYPLSVSGLGRHMPAKSRRRAEIWHSTDTELTPPFHRYLGL